VGEVGDGGADVNVVHPLAVLPDKPLEALHVAGGLDP
jgi:hypothetical protein